MFRTQCPTTNNKVDADFGNPQWRAWISYLAGGYQDRRRPELVLFSSPLDRFSTAPASVRIRTTSKLPLPFAAFSIGLPALFLHSHPRLRPPKSPAASAGAFGSSVLYPDGLTARFPRAIAT